MGRTEAKAFFADKVAQQARSEGLRLSDAERRMLSWSESDPDFIAEPGLADQLALEMSDEEYEAKIAGLLERSFESNVAADPAARKAWRQMHAALSEGDYYILIMIDRAVGAKLRPWWQFWR